jgi:hypothetical protein
MSLRVTPGTLASGDVTDAVNIRILTTRGFDNSYCPNPHGRPHYVYHQV